MKKTLKQQKQDKKDNDLLIKWAENEIKEWTLFIEKLKKMNKKYE